jgi:hypothetical protein
MTPLGGSMQMLSRQHVVDVIAQVERIDCGVNSASAVIGGPFSQHVEADHTLNLGVPIRGFCHIGPCDILAELGRYGMIVIANLSHAIDMKRNRRCTTGTRLSVRIWSGSSSVAIGAVVGVKNITSAKHSTTEKINETICCRGPVRRLFCSPQRPHSRRSTSTDTTFR